MLHIPGDIPNNRAATAETKAVQTETRSALPDPRKLVIKKNEVSREDENISI